MQVLRGEKEKGIDTTYEVWILQNRDVPVLDMYWILTLHGYSRIHTHKVSELIIYNFKKYFI